jgi:hypothetical protein
MIPAARAVDQQQLHAMPNDSWYYIPPASQCLSHEAVQIERNGRRWSGSWTVKGDRLCVESICGSPTVIIAPDQADNDRAHALLAGLLLAQMVGESTAP